ncbi:tellurite resistance TerB family protein [Pseudoroseicyclus aestuarii]|uniref:Uncharacterized protein DUF533 n=1 Tax=Pseudoroseicyclus aestuarii TaxID=1795041 RepID=A0A318T3Z4_9RHOB|nr:DUF533 domain-containing protein [Pseudoroseicyclus aestuarii]PYE81218.1 uncharacterized protein DUF533 [Pseudoroseicyclus aestuarii]
MSLKRILGTILVSRMAGRGMRRGGMGSSSMLGGLGYRRGGMGGKAGLAALGYMAYKAYRDHQSRAPASGSSGTRTAGAAGSTSGLGGLSSMLHDLADRLGGADQPAPQDDLREDERLAEAVSDETALLLIRAMITAAYSDGALSQDERARIMGQIDEAGGTAEDRAVMEREIANPQPLETLLAQVSDSQTAEEFYLASCAAVDGTTPANHAYLSDLKARLKLSAEQAEAAEEMTA